MASYPTAMRGAFESIQAALVRATGTPRSRATSSSSPGISTRRSCASTRSDPRVGDVGPFGCVACYVEPVMQPLGEAIQRAAELLAAEPRIRLVFLFGSAARQGMLPPRDVDLAVCAQPPLALSELLELQGRLQERVGLALDLVSLDDAPIVLAHEIVEGGRCLYARTPDDETEVVTRSRWWDWLPVRERQWQASGERLEERLGPPA